MRKYQYVHESNLPAEASVEEITAIKACITAKDYRIVGAAFRYINQCWEIKAVYFMKVIAVHIDSGFRVFKKEVNQPPPEVDFFEANINLFPEEEPDEENDVYVEMRLTNEGSLLIICNTHSHYTSKRLPK